MEGDNLTVLIMHFLDLPAKSVPLHHVVIELIPPRRRCEFRPREFGERGEVETVDEAVEGVEGCEAGRPGEESCVHFWCEVKRSTKMEMVNGFGMDASRNYALLATQMQDYYRSISQLLLGQLIATK